jgi:hypothetical protein
MVKPTPNPPESETESITANLHLNSAILKNSPPHNPSRMFVIVPDIDTESLLAHACESLASARVMATDFAVFLWRCDRFIFTWTASLRPTCDVFVLFKT